MHEIFRLENSTISELTSCHIFGYSVISSFYFCHSMSLSHCDYIVSVVYIIIFYHITILILCCSHYHIFIFYYSRHYIILISLNCVSIILLHYSANILSYILIFYYLNILSFYHHIQSPDTLVPLVMPRCSPIHALATTWSP
jgi:hypothetical protein